MEKLSKAALEEAILCLLCFNTEQAAMVALRVHDSNIFSNPSNQLLAKTALEYIAKYAVAPGVQLEYLLEHYLERGQEGILLTQTLKLLQKQYPQIQPQFVLEQLDNFIATQHMQASLQTAMELLEHGQLDEAKEAVYKQVATRQEGSPGIWLNNPIQALSFLNRAQEEDFFSSGISLLDKHGIRPAKKTFMFLIAAAKKGKSWWLIEVGKQGILHRHKPLHITLELSEEKTAQRYIQSIFGLTKTEAQQIRTPFFVQDNLGTMTIDFRELYRESIITKKRDIFQRLADFRSKLLIKEFPTGSLSLEQLSLYLDSLERHDHFIPDQLILDYADLMRLNAEDLRIDTGRLYKGLRGLSVARNLALVSASQGNRESEVAKMVGVTNVAEDWSKIGTADTVLTYSQTSHERKLGLARLFVAASRDEADKLLVLISQNYPTGQFCLDSTMMNSDLVNLLQAGEA